MTTSNGPGAFGEMTPRIPKVSDLMPVIEVALQHLGGEASLKEIHEFVVKDPKLTPRDVAALRKEGQPRSEVDYRMAWARTKL